MTAPAPADRRRIGIGPGLLLVLGALAFAGANVALWVHGVALDSGRWVDTVGPLNRDRPVASAVARAVVDRVLERSDPTSSQGRFGIGSTGQGPVGAGVREVAIEVCRQIIGTQQFGVVWRQANLVAHQDALALIGRGDKPSTGRVVLPLDALATQLDDSLVRQGIVLFPNGRPSRIGDFTIVDTRRRSELRQAAGLIDVAYIALPLAAAALLLVGMLTAGDRRNAVGLAGAAIAVACGLTILVMRLGPGVALHAVSDATTRRAAEQVAGALPTAFVRRTIVLAVGAALVAVVTLAVSRIRRLDRRPRTVSPFSTRPTIGGPR